MIRAVAVAVGVALCVCAGASRVGAASSDYHFEVRSGGKSLTYTLPATSVAHDTAATIPLLQQARALSPSLKLLATPWSAPGWMKIGGTFNGSCFAAANYLRNELYGAYARYFAKFVRAYQGTYDLPIYMV